MYTTMKISDQVKLSGECAMVIPILIELSSRTDMNKTFNGALILFHRYQPKSMRRV